MAAPAPAQSVNFQIPDYSVHFPDRVMEKIRAIKFDLLGYEQAELPGEEPLLIQAGSIVVNTVVIDTFIQVSQYAKNAACLLQKRYHFKDKKLLKVTNQAVTLELDTDRSVEQKIQDLLDKFDLFNTYRVRPLAPDVFASWW